jgi:hypothetical protein
MIRAVVVTLHVIALAVVLIPVAFADHAGFPEPTTLLPICGVEAIQVPNPPQYSNAHHCCFPELVPRDDRGGCGVTFAFQFLRNMINFFTLKLAPILVAIFVVWGGFVIMTSAGSSERFSKGKRMITIALIGAAIALAAFLIINAIFIALTGKTFEDQTTF